MLRQIAVNGHVYHHSAAMQDLQRNKGKFFVKSIGINNASVLPIFCEAHDRNTFAPLEQMPFTGTEEQCFLLAYRAICHEFSVKQRMLELIAVRRSYDAGQSLLRQMHIQNHMNQIAMGYELAVQDLSIYKQKLDLMLTSHDYSDIKAFIVFFETTPDVLCSSTHIPQCDFSGNSLQNLGELTRNMELITFSLIATDGAGAFVFSWHKDADNFSRALASSLNSLPNEEIPHAILRLIFGFCENHYLRPSWWSQISEVDKNKINQRIETTASPVKRYPTPLTDDGLRLVSWKVTGKSWV